MLITGANRGLGFGMIKAILNQPKENVPQIIVAACRKPDEANVSGANTFFFTGNTKELPNTSEQYNFASFLGTFRTQTVAIGR